MKKTETKVANMSIAATVTGIHFETIRQAKARACPAFDLGGRIDVPILKAWVFDDEFKKAVESLGKGMEALNRFYLKHEADLPERIERGRQYNKILCGIDAALFYLSHPEDAREENISSIETFGVTGEQPIPFEPTESPAENNLPKD
jgi:hypothetical protein